MPPRPPRSSSRPRHARRVLAAVVLAAGALVTAPGVAPRGQVLDLVGEPAGVPAVVSGQEPSPPGPAVSQPDPLDGAATAAGPARPPERIVGKNPSPIPAALESLTGYVWPLPHGRLTLPFGPTAWGRRVVDGQLFHDGVDLATFCGDRVVAAHAGTVLAAGRRFDQYIGWVGDLGPYLERLDGKHLWMSLPITVVIDDGNGYRSIYAHFGRVVVKPGQTVRAGQLLGYEGATGYASGCHLHYSLFSPWETATFGVEARVVEVTKLPATEIARIDPLLVFPPRRGINAPPVSGTGPAPEFQPPGALDPGALSPDS